MPFLEGHPRGVVTVDQPEVGKHSGLAVDCQIVRTAHEHLQIYTHPCLRSIVTLGYVDFREWFPIAG